MNAKRLHVIPATSANGYPVFRLHYIGWFRHLVLGEDHNPEMLFSAARAMCRLPQKVSLVKPKEGE